MQNSLSTHTQKSRDAYKYMVLPTLNSQYKTSKQSLTKLVNDSEINIQQTYGDPITMSKTILESVSQTSAELSTEVEKNHDQLKAKVSDWLE
jgi:gas vesicle protein